MRLEILLSIENCPEKYLIDIFGNKKVEETKQKLKEGKGILTKEERQYLSEFIKEAGERGINTVMKTDFIMKKSTKKEKREQER